MNMTTLLREKLAGLKKKYFDVLDEINVLEADGDLAELCNLRDQFDETFDTFFDEIRTKLVEERKAETNDHDTIHDYTTMIGDKTNKQLEECYLSNEDLGELVKFYEGYISDLEDRYIDLGGDIGELRKIYEKEGE